MKARLELILLRYKPRCFSYVNHVVVMLTSFYLQKKSSEVCIKARSTPASLLLKGLVTEHRPVKWSIYDSPMKSALGREYLKQVSANTKD